MNLKTLIPGQIGRHFADNIFTCILFISDFTENFRWSIWQQPNIDRDIGLALNRRQDTIWTNDDLLYSWINASLGLIELTHWGRDKMDAISQTTFSGVFSWKKMFEFPLKFHWSLFQRDQLTICQHWFRKWLGADQATSRYLNQGWLDYRRIYASLGLNELINKLCN